jgi:hypothetical protein
VATVEGRLNETSTPGLVVEEDGSLTRVNGKKVNRRLERLKEDFYGVIYLLERVEIVK